MPGPADPNEVIVSYSLREVIERIDERLVRVDEKLDTKASSADMAVIESRVDRLESTKDRAWGVLIGVSLCSGGVAGAVAAALGRILGGG